MLAYSFFAPTIYVGIICHKRVCADEIPSLCVFNFFERGKEKLLGVHKGLSRRVQTHNWPSTQIVILKTVEGPEFGRRFP